MFNLTLWHNIEATNCETAGLSVVFIPSDRAELICAAYLERNTVVTLGTARKSFAATIHSKNVLGTEGGIIGCCGTRAIAALKS